MSVRIAAALLFLLPAASCLASPIGVLAGPFAGQVLAQQRQQATHESTAAAKPDQGAHALCQPEGESKREAPAGASRPRGEMPADETVAVRNHCEPDVLPQPDKKRGD